MTVLMGNLGSILCLICGQLFFSGGALCVALEKLSITPTLQAGRIINLPAFTMETIA